MTCQPTLNPTVKYFLIDASLSYKVLIKLAPRATLKKDFELINNRAFQWKIQLNPGQNKQAQELYFPKKAGNQKSLDLTFSKSNVLLL